MQIRGFQLLAKQDGRGIFAGGVRVARYRLFDAETMGWKLLLHGKSPPPGGGEGDVISAGFA